MQFDEKHTTHYQQAKIIDKIIKAFCPAHLTQPFFSYLFFPNCLCCGDASPHDDNNIMVHHHSPYLLSRHAVAKIFGIFLGLIVDSAAYFAYIDSPWLKEDYWMKCSMAKKTQDKPILRMSYVGVNFNMEASYCPSIALERFLLCTVTVLLIVSFIGLVACCMADLDTVNECRRRESLLNLIAGIIVIIAGALFLASPLTLIGNMCRKETPNSGQRIMGASSESSNLCWEYFLNTNKLIAGGFGILHGLYYVAIACILENVKLYGMDATRPTWHGGRSSEDGDTMPPKRQSVMMRSRRSSVTGAGEHPSKVKKGVGSFGAVTSNMSHKGAKSVRKHGGSEDNTGVTISAPSHTAAGS